MSRLAALLLPTLLALAVGARAQQALWTSYTAAPDSQPNLPNASYAGYRNGESPLPSPGGPVFNVKSAPYNAVGDGVADDTAAIRAAIAAVGASGGVVYFPNGTYLCSGVLFVHQNGTVLRGESRAGVVLKFNRSLNTGYALNSTGSDSRWGWSGGMIWFTPASQNTYLPTVGDVSATWTDGWDVGGALTNITSAQVRGDRTFTVANAGALAAGQFAFIRVDNAADLSTLKHLCGDGTFADSYNWGSATSYSPANKANLTFPVEIAAVSGSTVTLKHPLRFDLRAAWNPRLRAMGDTIRDAGIENLTVQLLRDYQWTYTANHLDEPGWNGPNFSAAINCWLRGVTVVDPDVGIGLSGCKNVTVTDWTLDFTSAARIEHHHGSTCGGVSADCLFENFTIKTQPRHGLNEEALSAGNVWSKGTLDHGTFDAHRGIAFDGIRTEITMKNDGTHGGALSGGPEMGARWAHWNIAVTNNRTHIVGEADIMPRGAIVGVRGCSINSPGGSQCEIDATGTVPDPANLYEAQKSFRLPVIGALTPQAINENGATLALSFSVSDAQTGAGSLVVSGVSSNAALVPAAGIVFGGSGANRNVTITPAANMSGTATISLTVTDAEYGTATTSFVLTVNDAPSANASAPTMNEDTFSDVDLWPLVADTETPDTSLLLAVTGATNGAATLLADGHTVRFTPTPGTNGSATFSYSATDAGYDSRLLLAYSFEPPDSPGDLVVTDTGGHARDGTVEEFGTGAAAFGGVTPAALGVFSTRGFRAQEFGAGNAVRLSRLVGTGERNFSNADWTFAAWVQRASLADATWWRASRL